MKDLPWSLRTTMAPLGRKHRGDAKQIRDAGGIQALHICPATGNAPTRMTRASWEVLCAATQRRSRERECIDKNQAQLMRMTRRLNVCSWCQGKTLPRGLEFIDAAEMAEMIKPQEEAMAKQSKLGICENCGDKGALTGSFGKRVCATCLKIRSNVNSHLEKVATAARDMGKAEELLTALVPEGGGLAIKVTADLLQEISNVVGYRGEDPGELVEAVRKVAAGGAQQLASEAESGALRTIARIVGYDGTDGSEVVEEVRRRELTCASCEAEDVLAEIREIVGYLPEQCDNGLADAVRSAVSAKRATALDCGDCALADCFNDLADLVDKRGASPSLVIEAVRALVGELGARSQFIGAEQSRDDLLRASGVEYSGQDWDVIVAAAVQTIANLNERNRLLHNHVGLGESQLAKIRAELTLAEQSRDEWESRAVQAEANVQDQAAELNADDSDLREQLKVARELNDRLRTRAQESESRLIWYREALRVLRDRVGLAHLDEDEDVVERMLESIASMTYAVARHQNLASAAEARAGHLEDELERQIGANEAQAAVERELRATIAEQSADFERLRNQDLAGNGRDWSTDDSPLLDVALAVIRDEPVPADRIATLIDLARRASA